MVGGVCDRKALRENEQSSTVIGWWCFGVFTPSLNRTIAFRNGCTMVLRGSCTTLSEPDQIDEPLVLTGFTDFQAIFVKGNSNRVLDRLMFWIHNKNN